MLHPHLHAPRKLSIFKQPKPFLSTRVAFQLLWAKQLWATRFSLSTSYLVPNRVNETLELLLFFQVGFRILQQLQHRLRVSSQHDIPDRLELLQFVMQLRGAQEYRLPNVRSPAPQSAQRPSAINFAQFSSV